MNEFKSLDDVMTSKGFHNRSKSINRGHLLLTYWRISRYGNYVQVVVDMDNRYSSMRGSITACVGGGPTPIQIIRSTDIHFVVESLANSPHLAEDA